MFDEYRLYRVAPDTGGKIIEAVYRDTYAGLMRELDRIEPGDYVVYPVERCDEYTVRARVTQTVRGGVDCG